MNPRGEQMLQPFNVESIRHGLTADHLREAWGPNLRLMPYP